jgi:glycosyltransferase involved in cell wall biosynthesis
MIVKNEAGIICRCLDSVKDLIDYWVIVDTGSSDGTQEVIQEHLKEIPGELYEIPWENWGKTRSKAFDLAQNKGDYILFMDADDILEYDCDFEIPILAADQYNMWRGTKSFSYLKPQIVKGDLPWKWVGVTHEYLDCPNPIRSEMLEGIHYTSIDDGFTRSQGVEKYQKNIALLEEGLKEEPNNDRYAFYLAESYRDAGEPAKALEAYLKRIKMGGWDQETYCAKVSIGHMLKKLGLSSNIVAEAYKEAFEFRPFRAEAVYYLAETYNAQENYEKAYGILKIREKIPSPNEKDSLFNENWIEQYGLLFQFSICSYYAGAYKESLEACDQLLANENIPENWRLMTVENRQFPLEKLTMITQLSPE